MKNCLKFIPRHDSIGFAVLAIAAILISMTDPPASAGPVIDKVIAIVGKEIITQSELDRLKQTLERSPSIDSTGDRWTMIRQLIEEKLILQEVKRKRINVSDAELESALWDIERRNGFPNRETFKQAVALEAPSWDDYVSDLKSQLLILKLLSQSIRIHIKIDKETIQDYYDSRPESFKLPTRIRLKQLLLKLPSTASKEKKMQVHAKIEEITSKIQKGVAFDKLVTLYSEGPERRHGGDLGFFNQGDLSTEVDRVVFNLKEGEISTFIQTVAGFHFFKIEKREDGRRQTIEAVSKIIEEKLISETRSNLQEAWIDGLFEQTYVDIR